MYCVVWLVHNLCNHQPAVVLNTAHLAVVALLNVKVSLAICYPQMIAGIRSRRVRRKACTVQKLGVFLGSAGRWPAQHGKLRHVSSRLFIHLVVLCTWTLTFYSYTRVFALDARFVKWCAFAPYTSVGFMPTVIIRSNNDPTHHALPRFQWHAYCQTPLKLPRPLIKPLGP